MLEILDGLAALLAFVIIIFLFATHRADRLLPPLPQLSNSPSFRQIPGRFE